MARGPWGTSSHSHRGAGRGELAGSHGVRIEVDGGEGDLALALQGRLQETIDAQLRELERAYWGAMDRVVQAGKGRLRADIVAGGFHKAASLAKTWRGATYPKGKDSLEVAGWLTTKAGLLIDVFSEGTVIRVSGNTQFLAIPLGPAKAIVRRLQQQKKKGLIGRNAFGKFMKDDSYVEQVASALNVSLRPVIAPDRQTGVLVADTGVTLTPTGREAKNQSRAATPLFALAKTATLKKRIQGRALLDQILASFPADFARALLAELPADQRSSA